MNNYTREFLKKRHISEDIELNSFVLDAVDILESSYEFVVATKKENLELDSEETYWPILHDMYERSYEYVCGSLSLFVIEQLQSCEASCRTAIEGAVNLHYVSVGDSLKKLFYILKIILKPN